MIKTTLVGKWMSNSTGYLFGFVCKRLLNHTDARTDPPTVAVTGYCPAGYFAVGEYSMYS